MAGHERFPAARCREPGKVAAGSRLLRRWVNQAESKAGDVATA
jgi:hypothetical protein